MILLLPNFHRMLFYQIVMEYCGAGSVCDLMAIAERTLTEPQIAVVCRFALQGLVYLHAQKKIHRDIKSGNLLLTTKGEVKLGAISEICCCCFESCTADFGVSAELTNTLSKRKTVIGTPYWMAPEVLSSSEYDGKVGARRSASASSAVFVLAG